MSSITISRLSLENRIHRRCYVDTKMIHQYEDTSSFLSSVSSLASSSQGYSVHRGRPRREQSLIYDTAGGVLSTSGLQLRVSKKTARLVRCSSDQLVRTGRISTEGTDHPFYTDFSEPLATELKAIIGLRALFCIASVQYLFTGYQIRDAEGKIVCRLSTYSFDTEEELWVEVSGLKGYEKDVSMILDQLNEGRIPPPESEWSICSLMESKAESHDHPKSTAAVFHILPTYSTKKAFRRIIASLYMSVRSQEEGLTGDFDQEFLHDYRVGVRKLRTAMEVFEPVLRKSRTQSTLEFLKLVGTYSTPVRDLDVLLSQLLPSYENVDEPFFHYLQMLRETYHTQLCSFITSDLYEKKMKMIEKMIEKKGKSLFRRQITKHELELSRFAPKRLLEVYERLVKTAKETDTQSSYELIHTLRKQNKQFRYSLMFFQDLYGPSCVDLLESCKRVQDLLGAYTDREVLTRQLKDYLALDHTGKGEDTDDSCALLLQRLEKEREEFSMEFHAQADYLLEKTARKQVKRMLSRSHS